MALFTYTTSIAPEKTISEIQKELAKNNAKSVKIDYKNGQPVSLSFLVDTIHGNMGVKLPCNHIPVLKVLKEQGVSPKYRTEEQAYRVAWRILLYWIKAQMAIIETEMVTIDQVFLPYMLVEDNKTLYQRMIDSKFQITD